MPPQSAENIRQAVCPGNSIEICADTFPKARITHAVFDHDGTISVLRQGWEGVMEPMMIRAILGDERTAGKEICGKVSARVRDYIDESTGIQTILQMEALVEMVSEFGIVPRERMLDKFGYKRIFSDGIMEIVNRRAARIESGELNRDDCIVPGAVQFLGELRRRGVTLYLASGTDQEDLARDVRILGYGSLFTGGIYGAAGDVSTDSKQALIRRILAERGLTGSQLAVFGDGAVEMRECRMAGGLAIGVASDEVRRNGMNRAKRARLIKAGAHILVSDFSQGSRLLEILFGTGCQ